MECPGCEKSVSGDADNCPQCGRSIPSPAGPDGPTERTGKDRPEDGEQAGHRGRVDAGCDPAPRKQIRSDGSGGSRDANGTASGTPGETPEAQTRDPQPGQSSGPANHGGQYERTGSGSIRDRLGTLPLAAGAFVGAGIGCLVLVLCAVLTVAYPSESVPATISETDVAILTLFELHFVPVESVFGRLTVPTLLFDHFEEFRPPNSVFGLLYVIPILLLYRGGKLLARRYAERGDSLQQRVLMGATVAVGYCAVIGFATLLVPDDPYTVDTTSAFVRSGLLYPVLFGAIGGLVSAGYQRGDLRSGQLYAVLVGFLSVVLVFLSTYVTIDEIPEGSEELLGRAITTAFALHGALTLNLNASGVGAAPYLVLAVLFVGAGYLLVEGDSEVRTAADAFVKGAALSPTYFVVAAVLFTVASLAATPYLVVEAAPDAYLVVSAATESDALGFVLLSDSSYTVVPLFAGIGGFVEDLFLSAITYPVILGGGGGLLALRNRNSDTAQAHHQQSQPR